MEVLDLFGVDYEYNESEGKLFVEEAEVQVVDPNSVWLDYGNLKASVSLVENLETGEISMVISISESLPDIGVMIMALFHELDHVRKFNENMEYWRTHKNELERIGSLVEMVWFHFLRNIGFCSWAMILQYLDAIQRVFIIYG